MVRTTDCRDSPTLVSNISLSIFADLESCKLELDQLRCRSGDIKACIPDLKGNVLAVCTENICLPGNACPVVTIVKGHDQLTYIYMYRVQSIDGKCKNCSQYDNLKNRLQRWGNNNTIEEECLKAFNTNIMMENITEKITTSNPIKKIFFTTEKPPSENGSVIISIVYICVAIIFFVIIVIILCYEYFLAKFSQILKYLGNH